MSPYSSTAYALRIAGNGARRKPTEDVPAGGSLSTGAGACDDGAPIPSFLTARTTPSPSKTSPVEQELAELLRERGICPKRVGPPTKTEPNRRVVRGVLSRAVERLARHRTTNTVTGDGGGFVPVAISPAPPIIIEVDQMVSHLLDPEHTAKLRAAIDSFLSSRSRTYGRERYASHANHRS